MTTGKTTALTRQTFVSKVISLLFNMLSMFVMSPINMLCMTLTHNRCVNRCWNIYGYMDMMDIFSASKRSCTGQGSRSLTLTPWVLGKPRVSEPALQLSAAPHSQALTRYGHCAGLCIRTVPPNPQSCPMAVTNISFPFYIKKVKGRARNTK